jgi:DNA-binding NarL/FixJ family response regulator
MLAVVRDSMVTGKTGHTPRGTTTVVLVDDHGFVRALLRTLLEGERGLHVVGEAANGLDAARMVRKLQPNVAVVDIAMPGMNGLELTRKTRESSAKTAVVIYTFYTGQDYEIEAMRAGARAWVSKTSGLDELVLAIREAAAGRTHFSLEPQAAGRPRAERKKALAGHHAAVHRRN